MSTLREVTERPRLAGRIEAAVPVALSPARHDQSPGPAVRDARAVEFPVARENAAGVALTKK